MFHTKKLLLLSILAVASQTIAVDKKGSTAPVAADSGMPVKEKLVLTDPILKNVDGLPGLMDKSKIENSLWLIQEIKQVQSGVYRVNAAGEPDPARGTMPREFIFRGKKQNLKALMAFEAQSNSLTAEEKVELKIIFETLKDYFDKVNRILAPEAAGTHEFMSKLTDEFCRKKNRPDSILLDWNKGDEIELYRKSVTSFKIFNSFSNDLMYFLVAVINSCPKAFEQYKNSKKLSPKIK